MNFEVVLVEFGKWGPAGLIILTIAAMLILYGKYFLLPKQRREEARLDLQVNTFQKMGETLAALGLVSGQIHSGVTTTVASAEQQRAQMTMVIKVCRISLQMVKELADKLQVDLDEWIGQCRGVLDDGSAVMRAVSDREMREDRERRGMSS